ncbi:MAG: EpsG family protein, partial [Acutalibacteraceae bacterium]
MLFLIAIAIAIFCLLLPKNKIVYFCTLSYMFFLVAFAGHNADTLVYQLRFENYASNSNRTEVLFTYFMKLLNNLGVSYEGFVLLFWGVFLVVMTWMIFSLTDNVCIVLVLYMIYPFCMDYMQIRSSMAFIFIMLGVPYLFRKGIWSSVRYLVCVALACCVHFSTILFVLLIFAKYLNIKTTVIFSAFSTVLMFLLTKTSYVRSFANRMFSEAKVTSIMGRMDSYSSVSGYKMMTRYILWFVLFLFIYYLLFRRYSFARYNRVGYTLQQISEKSMILDTVLKINILILITAPLLLVCLDFYRVQRYIYIITYIALA